MTVVARYVCPECGRRADAKETCPDDDVELAAVDDPMLGTEVARFRLARLLGRGGMGRVYLGVHPTIRSRVAIKLISEDCADKPDLIERFFTEARAVNMIRHEGIANITDLDRLPSGRPYIVMEFLEGATLRAHLAAGPLPLGGLVQAMVDVLLALDAAHATGIIHRDLKPDNVMISPSGRAKVLDFGIAKLVEGQGHRTATGVALGTPQYMAPEQILGGGCDARTDVYAAGVMLYELVTGEPPFPATTEFALMEAHLRTPAPSSRARRREVPPDLDHVITRAMAKEPDARFASARAMASALREAALEIDPDDLEGFAAGVRVPVPAEIPTNPARATRIDGPAGSTERATVSAKRARPAPRDAVTSQVRGATARWVVPLVGIGVLATIVAIVLARGQTAERGPAPVVTVTPAVVDAAAPPDAAEKMVVVPEVIVDAAPPPMDAPARVPAAVSRPTTKTRQGDVCTGQADCPIVLCNCKSGPHRNAVCAEGRCKVGPAACDVICKGAGGFLGRFRILMAKSSADCREAMPCKETGACVARGVGGRSLECVRSCRDLDETCRYRGLCTDVGDPSTECIAGADADCAQSVDCQVLGVCVARNGTCVASDAGCRASKNCAEYGTCSLRGDECLPASDDDCRRSDACTDRGLCTLRVDRCVATDDATCAASPACRTHGLCKAGDLTCLATDETCRASETCTRQGRCRALKGVCER